MVGNESDRALRPLLGKSESEREEEWSGRVHPKLAPRRNTHSASHTRTHARTLTLVFWSPHLQSGWNDDARRKSNFFFAQTGKKTFRFTFSEHVESTENVKKRKKLLCHIVPFDFSETLFRVSPQFPGIRFLNGSRRIIRDESSPSVHPFGATLASVRHDHSDLSSETGDQRIRIRKKKIRPFPVDAEVRNRRHGSDGAG